MKQFEIYESRIGPDQLLITASIGEETPSTSRTTEEMYKEIASVLDGSNMRILHERVFGNLEFYESFTRIRRKCFDSGNGSFSYIQGNPCGGKGLAGVQIHAVRPVSAKDYWVIQHNDLPCGRGWKRNNTTYRYLTGIVGLESGMEGREEQASRTFDKIDQILASQSINFCSVARIWIFLEDILEWYDAFNSIRTEKFKTFGLIPQSVHESQMESIFFPASTGIGGRNTNGTAVIADVLAISGDTRLSVLPGVRQRSPYRYGSAFSRGVCIRERDHSHIFVSGTAAIDAKGKSLYPNDAAAQIAGTIETVESLIAEKGAKLEDIQSATVYLKRAEDFSVYRKVAEELGLTRMPAVCVLADICRGELLFEMDAMAVVEECREPGVGQAE